MSNTTELVAVAGAASDLLLTYLVPGDHSEHEACRAAALSLAVTIWTARVTPGGQAIPADLIGSVSPNMLGPGLISRIRGLAGPCWAVSGMIG